jgi:hypothetical protein
VAIVECGLNGYGRGICGCSRGHHRHHGCTVLARFYTVILILQEQMILVDRGGDRHSLNTLTSNEQSMPQCPCSVLLPTAQHGSDWL